MILALLILLPLVGSLIAALLPSNARNREAWLSGSVSLTGLAVAAWQFPAIKDGQVIRHEFTWLPEYGLNLVFRLDALSWLFTILVLGIGFLVVLYARYYMSPKDPVPRFFSFLLAFMTAMLGVVLSGNLIQLVLFWELTSITSFLLIGYWHHRVDARKGARMAFTITGAGGLCLLAGVLLLGQIVGSYDLDVVLASGDLIRNHEWYRPVLVLIALGALTKSAQFPFHFWLPHAMAAPTPVSAYLHSATMVKAGIFLLMRMWPVLSGTQEWVWLVAGAGVCTMLIGSFFAIFQHDLKGLLAYSTISHLGLITVLLGISTPLGIVAAIFHTMNHAIFKASLFMAAGIIDHESQTRDIRILSGLYSMLPITATLAIVASASMAGVPLLNGFLSKEMFFAEAVQIGGTDNWWMSWAALAMGIFSVAYSLRFISVFFGPKAEDLPQIPHEPPQWMRFPVELLVLLCLVVGIIPALSVGPILESAVIALLGDRAPIYNLAVWHGFNLPLMMSIAALVCGVTLYFILRQFFDLRNRTQVPVLHPIKGIKIFDSILQNATVAAEGLLKVVATRHLQPQFMIILIGLLGALLLIVPLLSELQLQDVSAIDPFFAVLWIIGGACAVAAAWSAKYHRLAALLLIGGTGLATSVTFLMLSAPDLALTQLMVETVTTVLILLGLRWLPPRLASMEKELYEHIPMRVRLRRGRDFFIAVFCGLMIAVVSCIALLSPRGESISEFFLLKSLPEGGGTNVVNVLLVDFRGFDTFGEITVLAIVALTVFALLRRFRPAPESAVAPRQQTNAVDPAVQQTTAEHVALGYMRIPAVYLRFLLPFMAMVAIYFFLRGHNLPGGGFVAGLIFSTAVILQYMLAGTIWVESRLRMQPYKWIAWGLLIAGTTGLGAWFLGYPFLTSHTAHVTLPLLGELHLPSAFMFDVGVFMVVVGSTMLILIALSHQTLRSHRQSSPPEKDALSLRSSI
ncbi:MAG: monovalent cation/H+ antiporter subunit A [Cellvibrio sp.]